MSIDCYDAWLIIIFLTTFDQKVVMGVKRTTRRKKVRFMRYFSIITAAATSLTILPVFDGITV